MFLLLVENTIGQEIYASFWRTNVFGIKTVYNNIFFWKMANAPKKEEEEEEATIVSRKRLWF